MPELVDTKELAQLLGVATATVQRWALKGKITPVLGGRGRGKAAMNYRFDSQAVYRELTRSGERKI